MLKIAYKPDRCAWAYQWLYQEEVKKIEKIEEKYSFGFSVPQNLWRRQTNKQTEIKKKKKRKLVLSLPWQVTIFTFEKYFLC